MAIKIEVTKSHDRTCTRIVGYVNGRDVVSVSNQIFGKWHTGSSSCLPSDFEEAAQYVACMNQVFETAKSHGA